MIKIRSPRSAKILVTIGLISLFTYFILILVLSLVEPGYNHLENTISQLAGGEGWSKLAFQIGGLFTGFGIMILSFGLHLGIDHGKGSKLGPIFIFLSGIGLIGVSLFIHQNIGNPDYADQFGIIRVLHLVFASIAVSFAGFSPIVLAFRFKKSRSWKKLTSVSFLFGTFSQVPSVIIFLGILTSTMQQFKGILEKLSVFIPFLWLIIIAIRILQRPPINSELKTKLNSLDHLKNTTI